MEIRYGNINDAHELAAVEKICFPPEEAASENSILGRLAHFPDRFWIIEDKTEDCCGNIIVSFVNGLLTDVPDLSDDMYSNPEFHNPDGKWQMIFGVDTLPNYRCRGLAGKIIEFVIKQCRMEKRSGVVLTCKERLIPFYSKFGFVNEGISKSVHGGAVWYQMRITFNS